MGDIKLEKVETQAQIDTLCAIANTVWHETFDPILGVDQTNYMVEKFQSDHAVKDQLAHQNYRYYLARLEGEPVGFVGYAPHYQGKEETYLSKVYILEKGRHTGVVRRLFDQVERETAQEGLHSIRLTVNRHNTHAKEVYQHYGYETVEQAVADIGHGYVMDDYIMVKRV